MTVARYSAILLVSLLAGWTLASMRAADAADNLTLRDGISFYQDVDAGFPIVGDHMDDFTVDTDHPTFIFFGASGDLNTNRQAKRLVEMYRKYHDQPVKFIIVDVDRTRRPQVKALLKNYYKGYIPFEILLDKNGKLAWSQVGEVDLKVVERKIDKALP